MKDSKKSKTINKNMINTTKTFRVLPATAPVEGFVVSKFPNPVQNTFNNQ